jgi:hypothetical protein
MDQGYQVMHSLTYFAIHDDVVEFGLRGHLGPGRLESLCLLDGGLGAPADQPADEFIPGRRSQEDELGVRAADPHLPCALQIDLQ